MFQQRRRYIIGIERGSVRVELRAAATGGRVAQHAGLGVVRVAVGVERDRDAQRVGAVAVLVSARRTIVQAALEGGEEGARGGFGGVGRGWRRFCGEDGEDEHRVADAAAFSTVQMPS